MQKPHERCHAFTSRADEIVERCPVTWFLPADSELTSYPGMTVQQVRSQVELELLTLVSGSWESRAENRRWP